MLKSIQTNFKIMESIDKYFPINELGLLNKLGICNFNYTRLI